MSHSGRIDWRRAFRAIGVMRRDPQRTDQVFELNVALDGGDIERHFQAFLTEPGGADLVREAPELLDHLADFERLKALPSDALGWAYAHAMERAGFDPASLRDEAAKVGEYGELYPGAARQWFSARGGCIHDLLHVLTGYGTDPAGEMALLAFADAVYGKRARLRVIRFGLAASISNAPPRSIPRAIRVAWQAHRRGRAARIPLSYRWEDALARPIAAVRRDLGIAPAETAHPSGILHGTLETRWQYGAAVT